MQMNLLLSLPLIVYENADVDKLRILTDNKKKAEISQWEHKESGNTYIGSSFDLSSRLKDYYKISFISDKDRGDSYINNAILSHGYYNFCLKILEYIEIENLTKEESRKLILEREQHYIDTIEPHYNILITAGSR
jgi:group I intron endonuclease